MAIEEIGANLKKFDVNDFPSQIRPALENLSKDIDFSVCNTRGANGYVIFGQNRVLKRQVVVKVYFWENGDHVEPEMLAKLEHPNILKIDHAAAIDEDYAYFATRLCPDGDLDDSMAKGQIGVLKAVDITMQACAGVSFLHGNGYLHRDLKPLNIFCDGDHYVIGDFGSVVVCDEQGYAKTWTRHSLLYRPPETVDSNDFFKTGDVYQLGLLLFQLLGGKLPYDERDWLNEKQRAKYDAIKAECDQQIFASSIIENIIKKGKLADIRTLPVFVPEGLKAVIRKAMRVDRAERYPSVADLAGALNNLKAKLPDWFFDEHLTLRKGPKSIRICEANGKLQLEKKVGEKWRKLGGLLPNDLSKAVSLAEQA